MREEKRKRKVEGGKLGRTSSGSSGAFCRENGLEYVAGEQGKEKDISTGGEELARLEAALIRCHAKTGGRDKKKMRRFPTGASGWAQREEEKGGAMSVEKGSEDHWLKKQRRRTLWRGGGGGKDRNYKKGRGRGALSAGAGLQKRKRPGAKS